MDSYFRCRNKLKQVVSAPLNQHLEERYHCSKPHHIYLYENIYTKKVQQHFETPPGHPVGYSAAEPNPIEVLVSFSMWSDKRLSLQNCCSSL